jgi:hypothetical protein
MLGSPLGWEEYIIKQAWRLTETYYSSKRIMLPKKIGMVKKEKSKIKHINIPGEGTDNSIRIPKLLLTRNIRIG